MKRDLDGSNHRSDETPVLVDLKPVGAGQVKDSAMPALEGVQREIPPPLETGTRNITGEKLAGHLARHLTDPVDRAVIRGRGQPDLSSRRADRAARQSGARRRDPETGSGDRNFPGA